MPQSQTAAKILFVCLSAVVIALLGNVLVRSSPSSFSAARRLCFEIVAFLLTSFITQLLSLVWKYVWFDILLRILKNEQNDVNKCVWDLCVSEN